MPGLSETEGLAGYWQDQVNSWRKSGRSQASFCNAHDLSYHRFTYWRRKFDEALKVQGSKKAGRAQFALNEIRKLYAIERDIAALPAAEKHEQRQARSRQVVAKLRNWLDKSRPEVAPKTALGKALG